MRPLTPTTRLQLEPGPFADRLQDSSVVRETNAGAIVLIATALALTTATRGLGSPGLAGPVTGVSHFGARWAGGAALCSPWLFDRDP